MYSEASILGLVGRIGFGEPGPTLVGVSIDQENIEGDSGRTFPHFHKLVTLENIYAVTNEVDMDAISFNAYLVQMKTEAVRAILTQILNQNKLYRDDVDYSDTIISKPELFDEAIGYQLAISAIEQMVSTTRVNLEERNANMTYQQLKIELEGARNENGYVIAKGTGRKLYYAIKTATDIIFPNPLKISSKPVW